MFIKKSYRKYKGKLYEAWHLAEAYRDKDGKVRHRYILNLTDWNPEIREKLKIILKNPDALVIEDIEKFLSYSFVSAYDYGEVVFLLYIMHKIGIIKILSHYLSKKQLSLIVAVLLNRIIRPSSKLQTVNWIKGNCYRFFCSLSEKDYTANEVYRAMDEVYENIDSIMEEFYRISEGKPVFLLYDITSVYFTGNGPRKACFGYSRDRRADKKQVLLGLVLNEKGFPVHFEVFEGNLKDDETVMGVIERIKRRFELERAIFIGDRGMVSLENLREMSEHGLSYIVALKHRSVRKLLKQKGIRQLSIFDSKLPVVLFEEGKRRYVLCGSEYRREHEMESLSVLIRKGREALESVKKMVDRGMIKDKEKIIRRAQKKLTGVGAEDFYDFEYRDGEFVIIEKQDNIEMSYEMCGYYLLETTEMGMDAEEVEQHYKKLHQIERYFRDLKELIEVRPVYHWKDPRVETHMFLCLISQTILAWIRRRLKESGWLARDEENSLEKFFNILKRIKVAKFNVKGKIHMEVGKIETEAKELLELFGLPLFNYERDKEFCSI